MAHFYLKSFIVCIFLLGCQCQDDTKEAPPKMLCKYLGISLPKSANHVHCYYESMMVAHLYFRLNINRSDMMEFFGQHELFPKQSEIKIDNDLLQKMAPYGQYVKLDWWFNKTTHNLKCSSKNRTILKGNNSYWLEQMDICMEDISDNQICIYGHFVQEPTKPPGASP